MNINSLDRFLEAQEMVYEYALRQVGQGRKRTHWMWFIFPQLRSLGRSQTAYVYGIADLNEAKSYLGHPILGERLIRICESLLLIEDKTAVEIFGEVDAMKLHSSMTLFSVASGDDRSVFHAVLERFFSGEPDLLTIEFLKK